MDDLCQLIVGRLGIGLSVGLLVDGGGRCDHAIGVDSLTESQPAEGGSDEQSLFHNSQRRYCFIVCLSDEKGYEETHGTTRPLHFISEVTLNRCETDDEVLLICITQQAGLMSSGMNLPA